MCFFFFFFFLCVCVCARARVRARAHITDSYTEIVSVCWFLFCGLLTESYETEK